MCCPSSLGSRKQRTRNVPELPEVEIIRRKLSPLLVGRTIRKLTTGKPSYFFLTPPKLLEQKITGRSFVSLERHGKYLICKLDDTSQMLWHLGMTGQLLTRERKGALDVHVHLRFEFSDSGPELLFRDVRKFGKVRWLKPGSAEPRLNKLGVDALEITGQHLFEKIRKRSAPVKTVLLDQGVLAGVGNIYADEALFISKIRPLTAARELGKAQVDLLASNIRSILSRSIKLGGSSISDYLHPDGQSGAFQQTFLVYGREGEPCTKCQQLIVRDVLGQRSTHYCPRCQR